MRFNRGRFLRNYPLPPPRPYVECAGVPEAIAECTALRDLLLGHNKITAIPSSLGQLPRLQKLSLRHNLLTGLPSSLSGLRSLQELLVNDNELSVLPRSLAALTVLRRIDTGINPWIFPPADVCRAGAAAIRSFLAGGSDTVLAAPASPPPPPPPAPRQQDGWAEKEEGRSVPAGRCERCSEAEANESAARQSAEISAAEASRFRDWLVRKDRQLMQVQEELRREREDRKSVV